MEIEDFDFDQDFLEGTQMYTFVDDDDDGLVDITDLNLPEPVPAAAAARRDGGSKDPGAAASATADAADQDDEGKGNQLILMRLIYDNAMHSIMKSQ